MPEIVPAKLKLADGTTYTGVAFGALTSVDGEVVFNTGMVGYPEAFTDPSYRGQILVMTYPLIGNYGVPASGFESARVQVQAVIVQDYSWEYAHVEAVKSLDEWLKEYNVPGIYGIDTRAVTKKLRSEGVMLGQIVAKDETPKNEIADPNLANLVAQVSCPKPEVLGNGRHKIIAVDCGMKENIIRSLLQRGVQIKRVPWDYNYLSELKNEYDGLFISNGPGDPESVRETIDYLKEALKINKPIFGICLGFQLLALADGAKKYKLKFGHRSQNQPCAEEGTNRCYLTTQNHGYSIEEKTIPKSWRIWFRNANDQTVEGMRHKNKPYFSVQFHPEACPGPTDTSWLFDKFVSLL